MLGAVGVLRLDARENSKFGLCLRWPRWDPVGVGPVELLSGGVGGGWVGRRRFDKISS